MYLDLFYLLIILRSWSHSRLRALVSAADTAASHISSFHRNPRGTDTGLNCVKRSLIRSEQLLLWVPFFPHWCRGGLTPNRSFFPFLLFVAVDNFVSLALVLFNYLPTPDLSGYGLSQIYQRSVQSPTGPHQSWDPEYARPVARHPGEPRTSLLPALHVRHLRLHQEVCSLPG